jgi:hypothetical protein
MIRLIAVAFALAVASSTQAMPPMAAQQPDETVIHVREHCGAGMHRVSGRCIGTPARRHARRAVRRCAAGVTCD